MRSVLSTAKLLSCGKITVGIGSGVGQVNEGFALKVLGFRVSYLYWRRLLEVLEISSCILFWLNFLPVSALCSCLFDNRSLRIHPSHDPCLPVRRTQNAVLYMPPLELSLRQLGSHDRDM